MRSHVPSALEQQFYSVVASPMPFILVCGAVTWFVWFMFNWAYKVTIDRQKATIEGLKEERDRLAAKLGERALLAPVPVPRSKPPEDRLIQAQIGVRQEIEHVSSIFARTGVDRLMAEVVGLTEVKARDVVRQSLGQPLTVSGEVFAVSDIMDKVTVSITLDPEQRRTAWLSFDDDHDRIRRLSARERITVTGVVKNVSSFEIQMLNCSLV